MDEELKEKIYKIFFDRYGPITALIKYVTSIEDVFEIINKEGYAVVKKTGDCTNWEKKC
jgi:hypothetical protein